jgi:hypothetical protein
MERARRPKAIVWAAVLGGLVLLAVGAGVLRYLDTMAVGTGETRPSPDGRFTASVTDWSRRGFLTGTAHRWFEYRVEGPGVRHKLVGEPVPGPYFGSRSSHRVIQWNADSSAVDFVFPGTTIRITLEGGGG